MPNELNARPLLDRAADTRLSCQAKQDVDVMEKAISSYNVKSHKRLPHLFHFKLRNNRERATSYRLISITHIIIISITIEGHSKLLQHDQIIKPSSRYKLTCPCPCGRDCGEGVDSGLGRRDFHETLEATRTDFRWTSLEDPN